MNVQIVLGTATIIAFAALLTAEPVASSDLTAAISDVKAHFSEQIQRCETRLVDLEEKSRAQVEALNKRVDGLERALSSAISGHG